MRATIVAAGGTAGVERRTSIADGRRGIRRTCTAGMETGMEMETAMGMGMETAMGMGMETAMEMGMETAMEMETAVGTAMRMGTGVRP